MELEKVDGNSISIIQHALWLDVRLPQFAVYLGCSSLPVPLMCLPGYPLGLSLAAAATAVPAPQRKVVRGSRHLAAYYEEG